MSSALGIENLENKNLKKEGDGSTMVTDGQDVAAADHSCRSYNHRNPILLWSQSAERRSEHFIPFYHYGSQSQRRYRIVSSGFML